MKFFILNAGSSSLKYKIFDDDKLLAEGIVKEIHTHPTLVIGQKSFPLSAGDYDHILELVIKHLESDGTLHDLSEIAGIGHRVVHGGEYYREPVIITPEVIAAIEKCIPLAPLHNPANLKGIYGCQKIFPNVPQVAVFDTAFHHTLPPRAYLYALPYFMYREEHVRRYGFHGTSHHYVSQEAIRRLGKKESKVITCHLGNGSSIAAILNGQSIDTSMGFSPLEGLPMGTRCGNLDASIVQFLSEKHVSLHRVFEILNKESGLLGLSEKTSNMKELWQDCQQGDAQAKLTIDYLAYQIAKYIGAYTAALNGLDALCFTGGLGENAYYVRAAVMEYLGYLGIKLSASKNQANASEISTPQSRVKVYIIPTDEERLIMYYTKQLV